MFEFNNMPQLSNWHLNLHLHPQRCEKKEVLVLGWTVIVTEFLENDKSGIG